MTPKHWLRAIVVALLGLITLGTLAPDAMARGRVNLGSMQVDFPRDRDILRVSRHEGPFSTLELHAKRNDVMIENLRIIYGNGEVDTIRADVVIPAGTYRNVDLKGRYRNIREIEFIYRSRPNFRGPAVIEVWGVEGPGHQAGPPPHQPPHHPGGWELLGERTVNLSVDRDVIHVPRYEGAFRRIRLKVLHHDIELFDLKVVYGNGEVDDFPIRRRVRDEEAGPVFDLRGDRRVIKEIILTYRATNIIGRTAVQVFGGR